MKRLLVAATLTILALVIFSAGHFSGKYVLAKQVTKLIDQVVYPVKPMPDAMDMAQVCKYGDKYGPADVSGFIVIGFIDECPDDYTYVGVAFSDEYVVDLLEYMGELETILGVE